MKIKIEKSDLREADTKVISSKSSKVHKTHHENLEKSKKIRCLVRKRENPENVEKIDPKRATDRRVFFTTIILLLFSIVLYQLKYGSCEFWAAYNKNLNKIVYGDENYCYRTIDTALIGETLRSQVTNQDDAIKLIEGSLQLANQEGFIQMAFHGSTGVGKSLSAAVIASTFKWRKNVQKFVWDLHQSDLMQAASQHLNRCGFNLIIVDDIAATDDAVETVNTFESELKQLATRAAYKVALVIIFKEELGEEQLRNLSKFVIVDFKTFNQDDLIDCIELHRKLFDIPITKSEMEDLIAINYTASGCKQVSKRLNLVAHKYK